MQVRITPLYVCLLFGKPIFVSEIPGAAQTMKLANNLLAACAIAISSEAFVFGVKGGLDPATMCEVFNASEILQHWTSSRGRCCQARSISVFRRLWLSRM